MDRFPLVTLKQLNALRCKFQTIYLLELLSQWRIQDFPQEGAPTRKNLLFSRFFAENCMKMKEFGPPGGGGGARPWRPPLDPPMYQALLSLTFQMERNSFILFILYGISEGCKNLIKAWFYSIY